MEFLKSARIVAPKADKLFLDEDGMTCARETVACHDLRGDIFITNATPKDSSSQT